MSTTTREAWVEKVAAGLKAGYASDLARHREDCRRWGDGFATAPIERTDAEYLAKAEAEVARIEAFRASPRGRFCAAVHTIRDAGCDVPANALEGYYNRSIQDVREPLNLQAVYGAMAVLELLPARINADALAALHDLIAEAGSMRVAA